MEFADSFGIGSHWGAAFDRGQGTVFAHRLLSQAPGSFQDLRKMWGASWVSCLSSLRFSLIPPLPSFDYFKSDLLITFEKYRNTNKNTSDLEHGRDASLPFCIYLPKDLYFLACLLGLDPRLVLLCLDDRAQLALTIENVP